MFINEFFTYSIGGIKMKKIIYGLLLAMVLISASIYAYGWNEKKASNQNYACTSESCGAGCTMHEDMQNVLKSGNFEDLKELREESGKPMIKWIQNEEDFELAQQNYQENGFQGKTGCGCPMMG